MLTETKEPQTAKIEQKVLTITPEIAADFLSRNVKNRKVLNTVVSSYAAQMKRGEWQLTPQGVSFNEFNELIDGQHRMLAVIEANTDVDMFVFYNVPDAAFKVFDTGNKRTAAQIFQMDGIKNPSEITSGTKRYLWMLKTKTNDLSKLHGNKSISNSGLLEFYYDNKALIDEVVFKAKKYYRKSALYPKSEIIAIYLYLHLHKKHSLSIIDGFFNQLFIGRNIVNNGIELLRSKLIQAALLKSHRLTNGSKIIFLKKVWNAFIEDKTLRYFNDDNDPQNPIDFI